MVTVPEVEGDSDIERPYGTGVDSEACAGDGSSRLDGQAELHSVGQCEQPPGVARTVPEDDEALHDHRGSEKIEQSLLARHRTNVTTPTAKAGCFSVHPAAHRLPSPKAVPLPVQCFWQHSRHGPQSAHRKRRYASTRSGKDCWFAHGGDAILDYIASVTDSPPLQGTASRFSATGIPTISQNLMGVA